ncbi:MAG: helix-turn-helix transcriptional regulator [Ktedonobacteraceae bacterium]|nr:helix-turn-helix transcriptional regulator [Ktedonobacteraceae bacterium]
MPRPSLERLVHQLIGDLMIAQARRPLTISPRQHLADTLAALTQEHVQFIASQEVPTLPPQKNTWFLPVSWHHTQYGLLQLVLQSKVWHLSQRIAGELAECCGKLLFLEEERAVAPLPVLVIPNLAERYAMLTPREREIFCFLGEGKNDQEIAGLIGVAKNTVKTHRRHIYEKLGLRNNREAMAAAHLAALL